MVGLFATEDPPVHQLGENDREDEHSRGDERCGNALCHPSAEREIVNEGEDEVPVGKGQVHDEGEGREDRSEEDGVGCEARARGYSSSVLMLCWAGLETAVPVEGSEEGLS
jgi:hypothetical protein